MSSYTRIEDLEYGQKYKLFCYTEYMSKPLDQLDKTLLATYANKQHITLLIEMCNRVLYEGQAKNDVKYIAVNHSE